MHDGPDLAGCGGAVAFADASTHETTPELTAAETAETPAVTFEDVHHVMGPFVRAMATRLGRRANISQLDAADLEQIGWMAIWRAFPRYTPGRSKLVSFFWIRAMGAMLDAQRDATPVTRSEAKRRQARGVSTYHPHLSDEDWVELTPLWEDRPVSDTAHAEFEAWLRSFGVAYTAQELEVMQLYYVDGWTMYDIGLRFGRSESRACQIVNDVVSRIRKELASRKVGFEEAMSELG